MGQYLGCGETEVIDEGFDTTGYARRMLWEYITAFGAHWGSAFARICTLSVPLRNNQIEIRKYSFPAILAMDVLLSAHFMNQQ